jgi:hypothetical protein
MKARQNSMSAIVHHSKLGRSTSVVGYFQTKCTAANKCLSDHLLGELVQLQRAEFA